MLDSATMREINLRSTHPRGHRGTPLFSTWGPGKIRFLVALFAALSLGACSEVVSDPPEEVQAEVEQAIREYLPILSQAYANGDVSLLRERAVEREVLRVKLRVDELYERGRYYSPELRDLTVESFKTWRTVNAVVTTVEVWDVRAYAYDSERTQLSEVLGQSNRVKYQLKREDGKWTILYRDLDQAEGEG